MAASIEHRSFEDCTQVLFQDASLSSVAGTGSGIGPGGDCQRDMQLQGCFVSYFAHFDFFSGSMMPEVAATTVDGNPWGNIHNPEQEVWRRSTASLVLYL